MKFVSVISSNPGDSLRGLPVLAIDLGFSAKKATCGVAAAPPDAEVEGVSTFGNLVSNVASWIVRNAPEVVLIIEAPLSGGFDPDGHPTPRGEFERIHSETGQSSPRNVMAGASMALAAIHLCKALLDKVPSDVAVHLVEGFASRYAKSKPDHRDVAIALLDLWRSGAQLQRPDAGVTLISVPDILSVPGSPSGSPSILRVPDGLAKPASPSITPSSAV